LVFHEIAYAVAKFLDWYDATNGGDVDQWQAFRERIKPSDASPMFRHADIEWLRDGIGAYWHAAHEPDLDKKADLVLSGNLWLAAYEQWRLQPIVQIALDPVARHLVRFHGANPHDDDEPNVILRRRGTPFAFRHHSPIVQWAAEQYETFLTKQVMAWEGPINGELDSLFLGQGVPKPAPGQSPFPLGLEDIANSDTSKLVSIFDHSHGTREGTCAQNWTRYADRMNFIVSLFGTQQSNARLFAGILERERRVLDLDLSDDHLDHLREIGDPEMDAEVGKHCLMRNDDDPRALVRELIEDNLPADDALWGDATLPAWADPVKLQAGRQFLQEHGTEIAAALWFGSLPISYTAAHGARVLTRSAELTTGHTSRRVAETGQMLLDLMAEDGPALAPDTHGSSAVRGVRMFHAAVRHMILSDPNVHWKVHKYGYPVNQEDLLGTLTVFTVVALDGMERLGVPLHDMTEQRDAYVHFWLVVGHLLGIDYTRLRHDALAPTDVPLDLNELRMVKNAVFRRQARVSAGGQILMASLLSAAQKSMPWILKGYPAAATRRLLGNEYADMLGVPPAGPTRIVVDGVSLLTHAVSPRLPGRGLATFASRSTRFFYQEWVDQNGGSLPPWRREVLQQHFKVKMPKQNG
jgi:hypothetical protein